MIRETRQTRRDVLKGVLGLTCGTCAGSASADLVESAPGQVDGNQGAWNELGVDDHPFSVRYRDGYESDAEQVGEWARVAYESVQEVYSHELATPITFDLYPDEEWSQSHGTMVYYENEYSAVMVTPSEYDGSYDDTAMFYRHGVTHEYVHAVQKDAMSFHTHARWLMEGFAEAVAVYHTDEAIYDSYHNDHHRARETRRDIERGYGYLLGVNEYVYRGSMHLLEFMITEYGSQTVGEIFEQDAENAVEALERGLGVTPIELEADWLAYAQLEFGGDYTEQIEQLGGTVTAFLSVHSDGTNESGRVLIENAVYQDDDYVIVAFDEEMSAVGTSDTFAAGERATDVTISLEREVAQPHQLTVRLHHAAQSGYGDPVEVHDSDVARTFTYSTSTAAVSFASPPTAGDTAATVSGFVAESYETDETVGVYVMDGDSTDLSDQINSSHHSFDPGTGNSEVTISLDESQSAVPLSDGQTVTATLVDHDGDEPIAETTATVGGGGANGEMQVVDGTATDTSTAGSTDGAADDASGAPSDTDERALDGADSASADATSADGPGFGVASALAGVGGLVQYLRGRDGDDS